MHEQEKADQQNASTQQENLIQGIIQNHIKTFGHHAHKPYDLPSCCFLRDCVKRLIIVVTPKIESAQACCVACNRNIIIWGFSFLVGSVSSLICPSPTELEKLSLSYFKRYRAYTSLCCLAPHFARTSKGTQPTLVHFTSAFRQSSAFANVHSRTINPTKIPRHTLYSLNLHSTLRFIAGNNFY